jgi:HD-GYP domain-containing protein (c-di-GMP phosphodiesterase class II)
VRKSATDTGGPPIGTHAPRLATLARPRAGVARWLAARTEAAGPGALDPASESVIGDARARATRGLSRRERATTALLGGGFLAAATARAIAAPWHRDVRPGVLVALVATYAVLASVRFQVGTGVALPTQLVLVPMLFLLPAPLVPLAVAGGLLLSCLGNQVVRSTPLDRALVPLASSWHALAPALVLVAAGAGEPRWSDWPIYAAALLGQFALDATSSAVADRIALGPLPPRYLLSFGWVFLIDACLAPIGLALAFVGGDAPYAFLLALPLVALLVIFARERRAHLDHALALSGAYRGTALLLGDVIEADDEYTGAHSRDVVELVLAVCDELGLAPRVRRDAEFTALLHDVGKIRIPSEIINKQGRLDPAERVLMETHTVEGERLLASVGGLLGEVGRLVRSCHERVDGAGYPDGLAGDEIPLVARIVACCDAYNAMTTDRSYRKALAAAEAVAELRRNAGTQFDPVVVAALVRTLRRGGASHVEPFGATVPPIADAA